MDQEDKVRKIEDEIAEIKRHFCDMTFCIHPMYLEWQQKQKHKDIVSRMFLDD